MSHEANIEARHQQCSICSQLGEYHYAMQVYGKEEESTYLPEAASKLKTVKELKPDSGRTLYLEQCPECKIYYLYKTDYEFLIGGSEDEQILTRLADEEAAAYLSQPEPQ